MKSVGCLFPAGDVRDFGKDNTKLKSSPNELL